ncbi:DMT family transporter [Paracoccaceae bacterium Fryx2]|nr:DMT family transporter [Paracoccaceae bacterium Fryx2]
MQISDNMRGALYMNIAMAAFTINDSCMKAVTQVLPLFEAISLRGLATLVMLAVIVALMGGLRLIPGGRDGRIVVIRSLAEVGATILFLAALVHMPLANLSAIMQSLPLAVTLVGALVFGDRVGWRRMAAIVVGFVGVLIIIRPGTGGFDIWSVMGLASVACVVVRDLVTRRLSAGVPSVTVAIWSAVWVTVMGLAGTAFTGWDPVALREALLLGGAAVAVIVGYLFVVMTMRVGDIGFVAPFRYMALLWAILLGWLSFGTLPDHWTVLGACIVVGSGLYTMFRERRLRAGADFAENGR